MLHFADNPRAPKDFYWALNLLAMTSKRKGFLALSKLSYRKDKLRRKYRLSHTTTAKKNTTRCRKSSMNTSISQTINTISASSRSTLATTKILLFAI